MHDSKEEAVLGDLVAIRECPKISKRKYFTLECILQKARRYICPKTGQTFSCP